MRFRFHLSDGDEFDADQYAADATEAVAGNWQEITPVVAYSALTASTGAAVLRDAHTGRWRAVRLTAVISVGEPGPVLELRSQLIDASAREEIERRVAHGLPERVIVEAPTVPDPAARRRAGA